MEIEFESRFIYIGYSLYNHSLIESLYDWLSQVGRLRANEQAIEPMLDDGIY